MRSILPQSFIRLAEECDFPLYLVGGSVRDFLCGFPPKKGTDWDISAPCEEDTLIACAEKTGFTVRAVYRNTGTVKLKDGKGVELEFTRFRSDKYVRGVHAPSEITFTDDITVDARRRDFRCNAIYYEIKSGTFCDPLGGILDVQKKILRTVAPASKVFGEDGLRLMRLCRFSAQLGFTPDTECLEGAKEHANLICDIVPERIFSELLQILHADEKHGNVDGAYQGLTLLKRTGVLARILPELALGENMKQRADFHAYDVLEHSFRCVRYAPPEVRLSALLHDVGKPFCTLRDGNAYEHAVEGARIATEILNRFKAPKKLTQETAFLIRNHMLDLDCKMRENKVRRALVKCYPYLDNLLALKQADFSACKDDLSPAPTVEKWKGILACMKAENAPLTMSELSVKGSDLVRMNVPAQTVGTMLESLLDYALLDGERNRKEGLLKYAKKLMENV